MAALLQPSVFTAYPGARVSWRGCWGQDAALPATVSYIERTDGYRHGETQLRPVSWQALRQGRRFVVGLETANGDRWAYGNQLWPISDLPGLQAKDALLTPGEYLKRLEAERTREAYPDGWTCEDCGDQFTDEMPRSAPEAATLCTRCWIRSGFCASCNRPEPTCSLSPCAAVREDRAS